MRSLNARHSVFILGLLFTLAWQTTVMASETVTLSVAADVDVDISIYPATGDKILLWLACNEGSIGPETRAAEYLAKQGIEVWLPDFLSAHFLPQGPSSIYKIPGQEVAAVIELMTQERPAKDIYLVAGGRAAAPLLRGAVEWEKQAGHKALKGAIMLYPRLNLLEPVPGNEPVYIEAVGKTRLPLVILEGERTPNRWGLPHLSSKLKQGGSPVAYELLPKVRGYFYTRPKQTPAEQALAGKLPELVFLHIQKLNGN
jgi:hypothetical protein